MKICRKKWIIAVCSGIGVVLGALFAMKYIFLCPWMYTINNPDLTAEEKREIKTVVLKSVKNRCSSLMSVDQSAINDIDHAEEIIQLSADGQQKKSMICLIKTSIYVKKIDENRFCVRSLCYYPEEGDGCYEFTVECHDGIYLITYFGLDA